MAIAPALVRPLGFLALAAGFGMHGRSALALGVAAAGFLSRDVPAAAPAGRAAVLGGGGGGGVGPGLGRGGRGGGRWGGGQGGSSERLGLALLHAAAGAGAGVPDRL